MSLIARSSLVLASLLSFPIVAPAPPVAPPPRAHHALVFDEARQQVLLTAGSTPLQGGKSFRFFNDVWAFDGKSWTLLAETGERLSGVGLAYDSARARVVSFGGYAGRSLDALRAWDGNGKNEWIVLGRFPDMAAAEPGLVYDAARDRLVTFGGSAARGGALGDTWEHDGARWTKVGAAGPSPRQGHAMVYDARRKRTVLFGGMGHAEPTPGARPPSLGDTWEYDGRAWTRREGAAPSPRHAAGVAYDGKRGRVILFGGVGTDGFLGDTWSWDGTAWTRLADSGPEPRAMGALAYDARRDWVVLFGGRKGWPDGDLGDTWEWDGTAWRRFDSKE